MSYNFWQQLNKNIFVLAPMEDVTDTVFREVLLSVASPGLLHVVYTEFCSVDGLCHPAGRRKVIHRLQVNPSERLLLNQKGIKLVAQIWGNNPEKYREAVKFISNEFDFDGIDINMGCPAKKIIKQGGCAALIGNPQLAKEIILTVKENTVLPVSIKTRTGIKQHQTEEWLSNLFECSPEAVILHCRTQSELSNKPADWSQMKIAVELRNEIAPDIKLIGNGDIFTFTQARSYIHQTGANGVMFGRGIFQNPWLFNLKQEERSPSEKIKLLWKHASLFEETWGNTKNRAILNRFYKIYASDFENAGKLKGQLMNAQSLQEVHDIISTNLIN